MIDDVALSEALHSSTPVVPVDADAADELRTLANVVRDTSLNTRRRRLRQLLVGAVLAALVSGGATTAYANRTLDPFLHFFADAPLHGSFTEQPATTTASPGGSATKQCTIEFRANSFSVAIRPRFVRRIATSRL